MARLCRARGTGRLLFTNSGWSRVAVRPLPPPKIPQSRQAHGEQRRAPRWQRGNGSAIGVQILWNRVSALLASVPLHVR